MTPADRIANVIKEFRADARASRLANVRSPDAMMLAEAADALERVLKRGQAEGKKQDSCSG